MFGLERVCGGVFVRRAIIGPGALLHARYNMVPAQLEQQDALSALKKRPAQGRKIISSEM